MVNFSARMQGAEHIHVGWPLPRTVGRDYDLSDRRGLTDFDGRAIDLSCVRLYWC